MRTGGVRIVLSKLGITDMYLHFGMGLSLGVLFPLAAYYGIYLLRKEKVAGFTRGGAVFDKFRQA